MSKARKYGSIISPKIDFWCVGGASIIAMIGLLIYYHEFGVSGNPVNLQLVLLVQFLINWPHFMASYRMLYASSGSIKKHPFATLIVPGVLISFVIFALIAADGDNPSVVYIDQTITYYIWLVAAFYLAWHYTGQAWGMVATFSYLAGFKLNKQEKFLIRFGLRTLLVWHVVWGAQDLPEAWLGPLYPYLTILLNYVSAIAMIAFLMGLIGFLQLFTRTKRAPTPQMLVPWLAIFLWYLTLSVNPDAAIFVLAAHSLQYLIFPLRVNLNEQKLFKTDKKNIQKQLISSFRYYIILITCGALLFYAPELLFENGKQNFTLAVLIGSAIAIHHYFVDSCIWRISNPDVRKKMFAHVKVDSL